MDNKYCWAAVVGGISIGAIFAFYDAWTSIYMTSVANIIAESLVGAFITAIPWILLLAVIGRSRTANAFVFVVAIFMGVAGGCLYYFFLVVDANPSDVFAFAIVPGIQFFLVIVLWVIVALTSASRPTR